MSDSDLDLLCSAVENEEDLFEKATAFVTRKANVYGAVDLLEFYGFYKQATDGPCQAPRPSVLHMKARGKWTAWHALGDMSKIDAQRAYVNKLLHTDPDWLEDGGSSNSNGHLKNGLGGWVVHSIESMPADDSKPEEEKTVFDHVKEKNLKRLHEVMQSDDLTVLDEHGMGLIHWATDRNAVEIIAYLAQRGVDVNLRDGEQQTSLHYATSCGHVEALALLLSLNADLDLRDTDGQTCLDLAEETQIRAMLQNEQQARDVRLKFQA